MTNYNQQQALPSQIYVFIDETGPEGRCRSREVLSVTGTNDTLAEAFGRTFRMLRRTRGLSLTDIGRSTGLSVPFLSKVERGLTSPDLAQLGQLAEVLQLSVTALVDFVVSRETAVVGRPGQRRRLLPPGSDASWDLLTPPTAASLAMYVLRLAPGRSESGEEQRHGGDECLYVVGGRVVCEVEGEAHRLDAGDSLFCPARMRHRLYNPGEIEAVVVSALSPPRHQAQVDKG